jgi:site-specific DNA-methyltransferase (adenine-specific)
MIDPVRLGEDVTLYLGDCLEILPTLAAGSVDAVVTDPPYLEGDTSYLLPIFKALTNNIVVTPGKLQAFNWIARDKPFWEYIWQSNTLSLGGSACLHIAVEPILSYSRPRRPLGTDLLVYSIGGKSFGHPWHKPIRLITKLVNHWSNPADIVLDPFMGSGTTGVACVQTGRRFIGIEIDPTYFEIAVKRIKEAQLQMRLPI